MSSVPPEIGGVIVGINRPGVDPGVVGGVRVSMPRDNAWIGERTLGTRRTELKGELCFGHIFSSTRSIKYNVGDQTKSDELMDFVLDVRDYLITKTGKGADRGAIKCAMDFTNGTATLTDPRGDEITIDLLDLGDPAVQPVINAFLDQADELLDTRRSGLQFSGHSKGNLKGVEPLMRGQGWEKDYNLPNTFEACSVRNIPRALIRLPREEGVVAVHRLLSAELLHTKLGEGVEKLITDKGLALNRHRPNRATDATARQETRRLEEEMKQLKALRQKLQKLDIYALTILLTCYPAAARWETRLEEIKREEIEEIGKTIEQSVLTALKFNEKKKEAASESSKAEYAQDIHGMFHADRPGYMRFCEERKIGVKNETAADSYLRALLHPADFRTASEKLVGALCPDASVTLKGELEAVVKAIDVSTIPTADAAKLVFTPIPPALAATATKREQKEWKDRTVTIEETNARKAALDFIGMRNNLLAAAITPPPPPPPPP